MGPCLPMALLKANDTSTMNLFSRRPPLAWPLCALKAVTLAALAVLGTPQAQASTAEHLRIDSMISETQYAQALSQAEALLRKTPTDAKARLLAGVALIELNRLDEAKTHFETLVQQFPKIPEAWNNLAVIHARKGELEAARAALEKAIRTHPSYAVAHDNLGDVYAGLASQAYDKALQMGQAGSSPAATPAAHRQAMLRPLRTIAPLNEETAPAAVALARPVDPVRVASAPPAAAPAAPVPPSAPATPPAAPATPAVAPVAAADAVAEPSPAVAHEEEAQKAALIAQVQAWAKAWSERNVPAYLAFYASTFQPPGQMTRTQWESQRRERITAPSRIDVAIMTPTVTLSGQEAKVAFTQRYRSSTFNSTSLKRLDMVLENGQWRIRRETSGG